MAIRRTADRSTSTTGQNDRRVQKTRASLREALHALIVQKPYEEISLKEVLNRANVGRSTFYTHFQDKDDLLAESIAEIVQSARAVAMPRSGPSSERLLWFSLPIFEYHEKHRASHGVTFPHHARRVLHEHLLRALVQLISDAVKSDVRGARSTRERMQRDLSVQFVASTFALIFEWWLDQQRPMGAAEINAIFRRLVLSGIGAEAM